MNEDKELEEAIMEMKSLSPSENAIKTVLQELENLQQKQRCKIIGNINEIKIEDLEPVLKPYYIPTKKIEDKINELKKEKEQLRLDNNVTWNSGIYKIDLKINALQELLEGK